MTCDYVKIRYRGKEYIGQIKSIEGIYYECDFEHTLLNYNVSLYEKGTSCLISDIYINSLTEIELCWEDDTK